MLGPHPKANVTQPYGDIVPTTQLSFRSFRRRRGIWEGGGASTPDASPLRLAQHDVCKAVII
ncbi:MAG: hypothetical protein CMJ45_07610 [Planctomyces sp.]|nr:hypothetical protein [Planctomyces sp.]